MDRYVTAAVIKKLRESKNLSQTDLADKLNISSKTVSKWETGRGYPDITMLEPLAESLGISAIELLNGNDVTNRNTTGNMKRTKFYVCPVCGNIIHSTGEAVVSCCGILLPPLEAEACDGCHGFSVETVEDEFFVSSFHPMSKEHYISFIAALSDDGVQMVKLYPEGNCEARFKKRCAYKFVFYCNRDGLFEFKA